MCACMCGAGDVPVFVFGRGVDLEGDGAVVKDLHAIDLENDVTRLDVSVRRVAIHDLGHQYPALLPLMWFHTKQQVVSAALPQSS